MEKTFDELVTLMTNHENRKRNSIAERFQFNMRNRKTAGQSYHLLKKIQTIVDASNIRKHFDGGMSQLQ